MKFLYSWKDCWGRHVRIGGYTLHICCGAIVIAKCNKRIHGINCEYWEWMYPYPQDKDKIPLEFEKVFVENINDLLA